MNILYLRYAVEVAKTGSINKAAEAMYVAQPNVSRAIKELEGSLGITIFERTTKGMSLTSDGERFMRYAKSILAQITEVENIFRSSENKKKKFSVSVPRSGYIADAFAQFTKKLNNDEAVEFFYKETNSLRAINNILNSDYKLGVIRYEQRHDKYFKEMLEEKGLSYELVAEFKKHLVFSVEHPLADKDAVTCEALKPYIEIAEADPFVPGTPITEVRREEVTKDVERRIFLFDRAGALDILSSNSEAFMWLETASEDSLKKYNLVEKVCSGNDRLYRDVLIYRKDYRMTALDKLFVTELCNAKRKYIE